MDEPCPECLRATRSQPSGLGLLPRGHSPLRQYWLAGVGGLELRNVAANYPFERSLRFPGIQTNPGDRDDSRLSCGVRKRSSSQMLGSQQGCLRGRWIAEGQKLPRFSADPEMIRRRSIQQHHCSLWQTAPARGVEQARGRIVCPAGLACGEGVNLIETGFANHGSRFLVTLETSSRIFWTYFDFGL
jgi:hypothetical protein